MYITIHVYLFGYDKDFYGHPKAAAAAGLLSSSEGNQISYNIGDYLPLLKSGKFPAITQNDLRLVLDRYLLTKVVGRTYIHATLKFIYCICNLFFDRRAHSQIVMKGWRRIFLLEITRYTLHIQCNILIAEDLLLDNRSAHWLLVNEPRPCSTAGDTP